MHLFCYRCTCFVISALVCFVLGVLFVMGALVFVICALVILWVRLLLLVHVFVLLWVHMFCDGCTCSVDLTGGVPPARVLF